VVDTCPMDRRYQVFVSSTYTDLKEERREVIQALLELDCLPAAMEIFPAANEDQWTLIKQVIDESDYYIVIVGGRYGSTTAEGISYTEQEYDYAVSTDVPVLGFVHANPDDIPKGKSDMEPVAQEALAKFRAKVMTRMVKTYTSPADLGSVVSRALMRAMKTSAREGWVRGRYAMTSEQQTEMAELRAQVAELKNELSANRPSNAVPEDLESGDDAINLEAWLHYYDHRKEASNPMFLRQEKVSKIEGGARWNYLIGRVGPTLMHEASEEQIRDVLGQLVLEVAYEENYSIPEDAVEFSKAVLTPESADEVIVQLFALGIIARGTKRRSINDDRKYWVLSQLGEDTLLKLRARRKSERAH
jgi:hypothetical protein